jgi:chromosome segregation ATPase
MATIFDQDELKYTQTDIDVRDARIRELEKALASMKSELYKYKTHINIAQNSIYGGIHIDEDYKNMWANVYPN